MRDQDAAETAALRHGLLRLPPNLHDQLAAEARAAYPNECCGLIEGVRAGDVIEALALHPTRNIASAPDRFEIDPAAHFRLQRSLRGTGREIVGCYHSHPDGAPEPSPRDRDMAGEEDFVWLVASVKADGACKIAAFIFSAGDFAPLRRA